MAFFGFGLGSNMRLLTLAVQNAVSPRMIGVATASATFTRQMGGTIGTAVFLSLLCAQAPLRIGESMRQLAPTAAFHNALQDPANSDLAGQFQSASGSDPAAAFSDVLQDSSSLTTAPTNATAAGAPPADGPPTHVRPGECESVESGGPNRP